MACPTGLVPVVATMLPDFLILYPKGHVQIVAADRPVDIIAERIDVALRVRTRLDSDAALTMRTLAHSRRILIGRVELQDIERRVVLSRCAQRAFTHPRFDLRAAPRSGDEAHRGPGGLLQLAREVVTGRGELGHRLRLCDLPFDGRLERSQRLRADRIRDRHHADGVVRGVRDLRAGIERAMDLHDHVRLAGAQPHVADQDVVDGLRL